MAASLFSVLHEEHLPADHHPHGLWCAFTSRARGVLFFIWRGGEGTLLLAFRPPWVSTRVWAASFFQLAPRLLPSRSSINDLTYSKTNNGNFLLVFQSKHASPAVSAAPRPNQHQMSLKRFFLFNHPSFLSGIPHSKRTGICQDLWDLVCFWELDEILKTCYIVRVWNETCIIALTHACMHAHIFKHA